MSLPSSGNLIPADRAYLRECLTLDLHMQGLERWRWMDRFFKSTVAFQRLLRYSEYWTSPARPMAGRAVVGTVYKFALRRRSEVLGLEVPRGVFGPGLSIAHSGLLVVHPDARVGARCRIHQGVTIGAVEDGVPVIGDDVLIGPNALVLGGVRIGDNAIIYPGAVCLVDVPPHHSARGVPARITPHAGQPWRPDAGPMSRAGQT